MMVYGWPVSGLWVVFQIVAMIVDLSAAVSTNNAMVVLSVDDGTRDNGTEHYNFIQGGGQLHTNTC